MKLKIVFFGTPAFAAECLEYLLANGVQVCGVVTQPDRPKGRSLQLSPSPVKALVLKSASKIPLFQPEKASNAAFIQTLAQLGADLFVVVAFGQILTQTLLDTPLLGCINVHASLLPKYRGAAPIQRCLMDGENETGIAIQKMVKQLDAGDVIAVAKTAISEEMNFKELETELLELAKPLLLEVIKKYESGTPHATPQNEEQVSYAAKISMEEGEIHWDQSAGKIHNLIRAFSPRPGAWCKLANGKRLKILRSKLASGKGPAGEFVGQNAVVACGDGSIQLIEVQPEGKKAMAAIDWLRGLPREGKVFISK